MKLLCASLRQADHYASSLHPYRGAKEIGDGSAETNRIIREKKA